MSRLRKTADNVAKPGHGLLAGAVAPSTRLKDSNFDGFPRLSQHRHPAGRGSGVGRHPVEPGRIAFRRPFAAGLPFGRHGGRGRRPGRHQVRRCRADYTVGSIALALILFDGGLRTRLNTFRSVLVPSASLATIGVLLTAALTAPIAKLLFDLSWLEALLVGAVLASTDAAAVFLLIHARGLRLRPRVGATLEVESGINDPFAIFCPSLVQIVMLGDQPWLTVLPVSPTRLASGLLSVLGGRVGHCLGAQPPGSTARPARSLCLRRARWLCLG